MSAVLIISIFLVGLAAYALLRSRRSTTTEEHSGYLPSLRAPRGLFDAPTVEPTNIAVTADDTAARRKLAARAARGDLDALRDAHATGDRSLYQEVLDTLVGHCESAGGESLLHLSREIIRGEELRADAALARALLRSWQAAPSRALTADLVRVAALSDDAATFGETIKAVFRASKEGELRDTGADELSALFENEYWILSPDARRSGAGFVLKRTLADLRRALSDEARRETPTVH